MYKVGIVGASGYTGVELVRILARHPKITLSYLSAFSQAGKPFHEIYPHMKALCNLQTEVFNAQEAANQCDLIFTALPHGEATPIVSALLERGSKVIDLSSDFRLHPDKAVYGLPEITSRLSLAKASLIANPGCYPTACLLAAVPLLKAKVVHKENMIFDCKSGLSGAGRSLALKSHFCEAAEGVEPYQLAGAHRHTQEIEQFIEAPVQFSPHLVPMRRGVLATCYFSLTASYNTQDILKIYTEAYGNEAFIRLVSQSKTSHVLGSNFCDISAVVDERTKRLIVTVAIDNLVKGASGQAVQNMNILLNLKETEGLEELIPLYP